MGVYSVCVDICVNTYIISPFLFFKTTNGIVIRLADFSKHGAGELVDQGVMPTVQVAAVRSASTVFMNSCCCRSNWLDRTVLQIFFSGIVWRGDELRV